MTASHKKLFKLKIEKDDTGGPWPPHRTTYLREHEPCVCKINENLRLPALVLAEICCSVFRPGAGSAGSASFAPEAARGRKCRKCKLCAGSGQGPEVPEVQDLRRKRPGTGSAGCASFAPEAARGRKAPAN